LSLFYSALRNYATSVGIWISHLKNLKSGISDMEENHDEAAEKQADRLTPPVGNPISPQAEASDTNTRVRDKSKAA
jgi:hypothetical protein